MILLIFIGFRARIAQMVPLTGFQGSCQGGGGIQEVGGSLEVQRPGRPSPFGPGPIWAWAHLGLTHLGPRPISARAHSLVGVTNLCGYVWEVCAQCAQPKV